MITNNPLQQFFRQPKIYISLPSNGIYSPDGAIQGDPSRVAVYGMTGMDEILIKTPDALLSGESTVKVIESCCPAIKDGNLVNALDLDTILVAIRIATSGNDMDVTHECSKCKTKSEYTVNLNNIIEHFMKCQFDNKVKTDNITIKIRPLTYKESTKFSMENFKLQQQIVKISNITDEEERKQLLSTALKELSMIQYDIFTTSIDQVETPESCVTDKTFIKEWLQNCDKSVFDSLKKHNEKIRSVWSIPPLTVKCSECGEENSVSIEMDMSTFFGQA